MGSFERLLERRQKAMKVLVVDDSTTMRAMFHGIISDHAGYEVVGLAKDAKEAITLIDTKLPDVVVIDLCMPYISGSELLSMLQGYPHLQKVVLSARTTGSDGIRTRLLELGAAAFFDKAEVARDPAAFRTELRRIVDRGRASSRLDSAENAASSTTNVIYAAGRFPVPRDEDARVHALAEMDLANLQIDPCLDIIARHLAGSIDYPIVAVNLVDAHNVWAKAAIGFDRQAFPREESICTHVLCQGGPLVVADTMVDARFRSLPMVTGDLCVRSYVGVPILAEDGVTLGVVCAADKRPRRASKAEISSLADAAKLAGSFLDDRVRARRHAA